MRLPGQSNKPVIPGFINLTTNKNKCNKKPRFLGGVLVLRSSRRAEHSEWIRPAE
jgi:hypothetical protein